MIAPLQNSSYRGFSVLELLIVLAMVSIVSGFALVNLVHGRRALVRKNAAVQLAGHLKNTRLDSMRRKVKDVNKMAELKIYNRSFYSVSVDKDSDGQLDTPMMISLPEDQGVEIKAPFPTTFTFDWLGQPVDSRNQRVASPVILFVNSGGTTAVKISETGEPVVVTSPKPS